MSTLFILFVLHLLSSSYAAIEDTVVDGQNTEPDVPQYATIEEEPLDDGTSTEQGPQNCIPDLNLYINEQGIASNTEVLEEILPQSSSQALPEKIHSPLIVHAMNLDSVLLNSPLNLNTPNSGEPDFKVNNNDGMPYVMRRNETKLYLCPFPNLKDQLQRYFENDTFSENCLYQTTFGPDEPKACEFQKKSRFIEVLDTRVIQCIHPNLPFQRLYIAGSQYCFPVSKPSQGGQPEFYKKGIKSFINEPKQDSEFEFRVKNIYDYFICYDVARKKTTFTIHQINPPLNDHRKHDNYGADSLSIESFDIRRNRFAEMREAFRNQDVNSLYYMAPRKLVPRDEKSNTSWKKSASHYANVWALWKFMIPLMNLVEEHTRRYANQKNRSLLIQTKVIILPASFSKKAPLHEFLHPSVWIKVIFDRDAKSGIIIVVYSTPFVLPKRTHELCREPALCDFKEWTKISKSITTKVHDYMLLYAYCCKSLDDRLRSEIRFDNLLDINLEETNPPEEDQRGVKRKLPQE